MVNPGYIECGYTELFSISKSCKMPLENSCKCIALYYACIKLPFTSTFNVMNVAPWCAPVSMLLLTVTKIFMPSKCQCFGCQTVKQKIQFQEPHESWRKNEHGVRIKIWMASTARILFVLQKYYYKSVSIAFTT